MRSTFRRSLLPVLRGFSSSADAVTLLPSAADYRRCLLEKIASATQRIYVIALYLQQDEAGQEILEALYAAKTARPELDVVVLVDWFRAQRGLIGAGKQPGNSAWYQAQNLEHDVEVPIYGVPVQTRELFGVLHLKGTVIDDCVIYSGASINNVYLHKFDKYRLDRYHLLQNTALADSMQHMVQQDVLTSKAVHRLDLPSPPTSRSLRGEIRGLRNHLKRASYDTTAGTEDIGGLRIIPLLGVGNKNPLSRTICELIAASQTQLTLCTPYFNLPVVVTREINRALKRGVKIDIIIGDKTANDFFIPADEPFKVIAALPYLYEISLRKFARKHQQPIAKHQLNLHLWKDGDNTFHLKGLWADERYTLLTGNNLNPRAFQLDLENALLIDDPRAEWTAPRTAELTQLMRNTLRVGKYDELDTLSEYPLAVRTFLRRVSRVRIERLLYRIL
ncbi:MULTISPECIES: CDP-diacylglycerol--serine O-phosphatidyltransferase [unclassified Pseudomonas]|uniref:CDP-diacylglycerol--serine O-phosphatidyltransferase n=1 Tax=unclassified Pseudomonas TaxID=196821 RepID=UPI002AC8C5B0|nr:MULTISPECIES: CDP-diacylglycerol--serine O-phosphatidyltransferase [unclassified Pseudomonas]MEB0043477.1 CDP-diacylglycerol--serine O-phosphatidyltransferase [Pseudomonas sp. MH10]MEB0079135.1 CDP-diacylglycerol--serine O-phosphatidyltransferase [Pseudomonas sp. MH10out]MEB0092421.1 CDP-diacylglycerol--serine O-phosphatidyltransferase [Pseudomonas sp. CCI4.2]MEB0102080.1 CDP-diacylglycerol--serine O-phosphatidyltransferase [Pseudomonas sp. CCI3.2]MEB0122064.1 CDP-diacylglycerol--serine O-p